jgi:hypothetical protein
MHAQHHVCAACVTPLPVRHPVTTLRVRAVDEKEVGLGHGMDENGALPQWKNGLAAS